MLLHERHVSPELVELQSAQTVALNNALSDIPFLDSATVFHKDGTITNPVALAVSSVTGEVSDGFAGKNVIGRSIDLLPRTRLSETYANGIGNLALSRMHDAHLTWGQGIGEKQRSVVVQAAFSKDLTPVTFDETELQKRIKSIEDVSLELYAYLKDKDAAHELRIEPQTTPNACLISYDLKHSRKSIKISERLTIDYLDELNDRFSSIMAHFGGRTSQNTGDGRIFFLNLPKDVRLDPVKLAEFEKNKVEPILELIKNAHAEIAARYTGDLVTTDIHLGHAFGVVETKGRSDRGEVFWDLNESLKNE